MFNTFSFQEKFIVQKLVLFFFFIHFSLCQKNRRTNRLNSFVSPFSLSKGIQRTNRLRILLILPFTLNKRFQRTNCRRYLLFPLTKIQRTNRLRILCLNTLEGTSFVVQVEGTSTLVVVLRTREGTSLVDQFKWRVHPLGCSKRTREGASLVDLACKGFYKIERNLKDRKLLRD